MLSVNFALMQNFYWSLAEIEGMMSWERRVYIELLMDHLKQEKERMESLSSQR